MRKLLLNEQEIEHLVLTQEAKSLRLSYGGEIYTYNLLYQGTDFLILKNYDSGEISRVEFRHESEGVEMELETRQVLVKRVTASVKKSSTTTQASHKSPMPGKIFKILVSEGDSVEKGEPLVILEAMKMEHTIKAAFEGVVEDICFTEGELVQGGQQLVNLAPKDHGG